MPTCRAHPAFNAIVSQAPSAVQIPTGHDPLEGVSGDGMIVTGALRSRVPAAFEPVIAQAVAQVQALHGDHSLYVYGSVATGMARVGGSDVDLVTIGMAPAIAATMARELSAAHANLCRGVEVGAAQRPDYQGSGGEAYGNRVFLRHYCVHLTGPDVAHGLPEYPADADAARGFNGDIALCLDRWRIEIFREPSPVSLARRMARKTLLAVAGLVSIHDSTWTTDRVAAALRWAIVRPELAAPLDQLVEWSHAGRQQPSRADVQAVLDGLVVDVVDDFQRRIGLWTR